MKIRKENILIRAIGFLLSLVWFGISFIKMLFSMLKEKIQKRKKMTLEETDEFLNKEIKRVIKHLVESFERGEVDEDQLLGERRIVIAIVFDRERLLPDGFTKEEAMERLTPSWREEVRYHYRLRHK